MNKLLLWFTGIIVLAFVVTFPTRDRRGMVDRIRLQVGAKNLVSKKTLREVAAEQRAKVGRKGDKFNIAAAGSPMERQERLNKSIKFYCNDQFNRQVCTQWLSYCGEMCRSLVNPQTWASIMNPPRNRSTASTSRKAPQTVAARSRR